jgi:uncharacterized protein YdhG (YjbR/CyaY superfamily)
MGKVIVYITASLDGYIKNFPENIQKILEKKRRTIHQSALQSVETISYQMPMFKLNGILVYFAGYKKHIGFYPTASGIAAFKK